jgi:hypothetical protein
MKGGVIYKNEDQPAQIDKLSSVVIATPPVREDKNEIGIDSF